MTNAHALCAPSNGIRYPFHTFMKINNNPPSPFWLSSDCCSK
jgi:hypothetical protein